MNKPGKADRMGVASGQCKKDGMLSILLNMKLKNVLLIVILPVFVLCFVFSYTPGLPFPTVQKQTAAEKMESVEIKWLLPCETEPADSKQVLAEANKMLEDIRVMLNITWVDWDSYEDKLGVLSASNDSFDLCLEAGWLGLNEMVSRNAFYNIDELLPQYAPDVQAQVPSYVWDTLTMGGKLVGMPNLQVLSRKDGVYIRKDLADKYHYNDGMIKNLDDITRFLKVIKAGEKDIYGTLQPQELINYYSTIAGFFDVGDFNLPGTAVLEDGKLKIINQYESDAYKTLYNYVRDWYRKGYSNKDAAILRDTDRLRRSGKEALMFSQLGPWTERDMRNMFAGTGYEWIPCDLGAKKYITAGTCLATLTCVGANSKNPEKAVMLFNKVNTDARLYNTLVNGIEGRHYILKDGFLEYPKGMTAENSGYYTDLAWGLGSIFNLYPTREDGADFTQRLYDWEKDAIISPTIGFSFDPALVSDELSQCRAVITEYFPFLANGAGDPDKLLPDFLARLREAGSDRIIAEKQRQIDAWK